MALSSGIFIALEGLDGAGTTTQATRLAEYLRSIGRDVCLTCEPSTGEVGKLLRRYLSGEMPLAPSAMALLFAADRVDHLDREVRPALQSGAIVISDRYLGSSLAYQSTALGMDWVDTINGFAPHADLTLYLRVAPAVAAKRLKQRAGKQEIYDAIDQQERICLKYDAIFGYREGSRLPEHLTIKRGQKMDSGGSPAEAKAVILNGELSTEDVFDGILRAVEKDCPESEIRGTIAVGGK
jgi:dTMP kinase